MKRILILLIIFSFILFAFPAFGQDDPQTILYEVDENYPPFTYTSDAYLYGFDIDLTHMIFENLTYKLVFSSDRWINVYPRLVNREIDIAGIIAVTDARKNEVLFSDVVLNSYVSVFTRSDFEAIKLEDLKNYNVGVGKGYYTEALLKDQLGVTNYMTYDQIETGIMALESGSIDIIFENQQLLDHTLIEMGLRGAIIPQITNLFATEFAYGISKNHPELVTYINKRLEVLKKSGVYEEIYMKYFYNHSEWHRERLRSRNMSIIIITATLLLLLMLSIRYYVTLLKRKIHAGYEDLELANTELLETQDELQQSNEEIQAQYEEIQTQFEEIQSQYLLLDDARNALIESESRYRLVAEGANDCIWDWQVTNDTAFLSEHWREKLGYEGTDIKQYVGFWIKRINKEDRSAYSQIFDACLMGKMDEFSYEYRFDLGDEQEIWVLTRGKVQKNQQGHVVRIAGSHTDITGRKRHEETVYRLAYYDALTGLPNRTYLAEYLSIFMFEERMAGTAFFIELDDFKHINDTLGHDFGDQVLIYVSQLLKSVFSKDDFLARIGGDEFFVVFPNTTSREDACVLADKVLRLFNRLYTINAHEVFLSASIGITLIPEHGVSVSQILKHADTAMYDAKKSGKATYRFFDEAMLKNIEIRSKLEKDLRKAIENEEFRVFFQPYYDTYSRELSGMEALIRWEHPVYGMVPPLEFIPLAEELGLIVPIGKWILTASCVTMKKWQSMTGIKVPISVNVAEQQLEVTSFLSMVTDILKTSELEPEYLQLEITESSIMKSIDKNIGLFNILRVMGVKIALDDFGTGYSSLSYIQRLPIDTLKIDKSFVDEIIKKNEKSLIIGDIISIAHRLKMKIVAEGVEKDEQLQYLKRHDCDYIQGYLFSKPLSEKAMQDLLEREKK